MSIIEGLKNEYMYDTIVVSTHHYKHCQTHRLYDAKRRPWCPPWAAGGDDVSVEAGYAGALDFLLNFAGNLKLL